MFCHPPTHVQQEGFYRQASIPFDLASRGLEPFGYIYKIKMLVTALVRTAAVSAAMIVQLQGFTNVEAFIVPSPATTAVPLRMMLSSSSSRSRCAPSRGKVISMSAVQVRFIHKSCRECTRSPPPPQHASVISVKTPVGCSLGDILG